MIKDYINSNSINSSTSLVLSGGVALNCKLNYLLSRNFSDEFEKVWAYPASGDAGSSVGACVNYLSDKGISWDYDQIHTSNKMFLGSQYSNSEVICSNYSIIYHKTDESESLRESLIARACKLLREGKIGAIYQNKSEFGPRALGNRSIIADATNPNALNRLIEI